MLTKSKYLSGQQCVKRLWVEEHAPILLGPASPTQAHLRRQGSEVGKLARRHFPNGQVIGGAGRGAVAATQAALDRGATCLFEAAFLHEEVLVRCDVLVRQPNDTWTLIEVKSTTQVKRHHLHDLAVQAWVLEAAGLTVGRIEVMHLNNRNCVYPDLEQLFVRADVTRLVRRLVRAVPKQVRALQRRLQQATVPNVPIGPYCYTPFGCPVRGHCWRDVPSHSVFTIPRLGPDKLNTLLKLGIVRVQDIPSDFPLSPCQWAYIRRVVAGRAEIAPARIAARLDRLVYPLYFLDFESFAYAVPRYAGMRPYQQLPFQYSLHVLAADGTLTHREYLHTTDDDPRPHLAARLTQEIGPVGSLVVYHAAFERTILQELARALPDQRAALRSMAARLWDQLEVFQVDYLDPAFEGSNSIKRVLPVLAPELSYDDLEIQRGDHAQAAWQQLLHGRDPAQAAALAAQLRAYCHRDTLAMVAIHRKLVDVAHRA